MDSEKTSWFFCVLAGFFCLFLLFFVLQEAFQKEKASMLQVKTDLFVIDRNIKIFKNKKNRYPFYLNEIIEGDTTELQSLPKTPWGGEYQYKFSDKDYLVWVAPDEKTKKIYGVEIFSNNTKWEGLKECFFCGL